MGERVAGLDALRGAATLAGIPIAARWILHPRAHAFDPTVVEAQTAASIAWWHLSEVLADETWLWLLAGAFGMGLAAARGRDPSSAWVRTHYARMAVLIAIGLAWSLLVWPGDVLVLLGLTGLMITGAVTDRDCLPWRLGIGTGAAAIAASLALADGTGPLLMSGRLPNQPAEIGSASYNAWETRMYKGDANEGFTVRGQQMGDLWSRMYPARMLWQCASAMLLGIWWFRAGRHRRWRKGTAWALGTVGLLYTAVATWRSHAAAFDDLVVTTLQNGTYVGGALLAAGLAVALTGHDAGMGGAGRRWLATAGRHSLTL